MAKLSNINNLFSVDSTGAIEFSTQVGATGYVLESRGAGNAPVWTDRDTGGVRGTGTENKVVRWNVATATGVPQTIGDGPITFSGSAATATSTFGGSVDINGGLTVSPNTAGKDTFTLTTNASNDGRLLIKSDTTTKVDIQANGDSYFNGGNVGIGITSPDTRLHIYGSSTVSEMYLGEDAAVDKAGILKYNQGDGTGTGTVQLGNWGDNLSTTGITIKKGGNVGIGTNSPDALLDLESATPALRITDTDSNAPYELKVDGGTFSIKEVSNSRTLMSMTTGAVITLDSLGSNTVLNTSGSVVVPNGSVGIGTTSPDATLDVHAPSTTAPSLTMGAAAGQIFKNEDLEFAFGLNNASPYNGWMQTRFAGNASRSFSINPLGGNVGIGTNSPGGKLHISDTSTQLILETPNTTNDIDFRFRESGTNKWNMRYQNSTNDLQFLNQTGTAFVQLALSANGRVNISNKPNSGLGYAVLINVGAGDDGDVGYQTLSQLNTNLAGASDIRFKKNIEIIPNAIEKIKTINGYTFDWDSENEDYNYSEKEGRDAGIIAQEIQKVLPEIVQIATVDRDEEGKSTSGKNYLSVDYKKIIPLLIQGIKEQETSIQELEARIKILENK